MSRSLGSELPADLLDRLSGRDLAAVASKVIQIFTIDERGWAHPALLSHFEVVAIDERRIRLATYARSTTTANMRRSGRLTMVLIDVREAYYIKGRAVELVASMQTAPRNAAFECLVADVLADEPNEEYEPGAYVSSGVTYYKREDSAELARARAVLEELRQSHGTPG